MYAVKVSQGRERIRVRGISSGFLPSYQTKPGVRLLVVPGYVFTLSWVRDCIPVPEEEWEIIEKLSASKMSVMDAEGRIVSGPLADLDSYVVYRGQNSIRIRVKLLGLEREYWMQCKTSEDAAEEKNAEEKKGEEKTDMAQTKVVYTDEQKAAMMKRAEEIGVHAAAKELGVAWQTIAQMKRRAAEASGAKKPAAKKTAAKKPAGKKTAVQDSEEKKVVMTTAPERPATELEIENMFLRDQVKELTGKVEKLKKALADLL